MQKALRKLATSRVPTSVSQLVMWKVSGGLDWETIAQLAEGRANPYELSLARNFVDHLGDAVEGDRGRLLLQFDGTDEAGKQSAARLGEFLKGKTVLGLPVAIGVPARPEGPSVACRVRITGTDALVQIGGSDRASRAWVAVGKFTLPVAKGQETFDPPGSPTAWPRDPAGAAPQLVKGVRDKGKLTYGIKVDNASPLILNGLAVAGSKGNADESFKVLRGIGIAPRRYLILPATEETVKSLGLKQGIRVTAVNLSGL